MYAMKNKSPLLHIVHIVAILQMITKKYLTDQIKD
uniref:Uncharacterized protein n=1 Tax=Anguilla anguilla TaxID=7936 RepID=A0A0E9RRN8_ANGAN